MAAKSFRRNLLTLLFFIACVYKYQSDTPSLEKYTYKVLPDSEIIHAPEKHTFFEQIIRDVSCRANESATEETLTTLADSSSNTCSCFNPKANKTCCERAVRRSHKMGYILIREVYKFETEIDVNENFRRELPSLNQDYRDVIVTRNWYDAILSGYFYHKDGRECHKNLFGAPALKPMRKPFVNWPGHAMWTKPHFPPKQNRSICDYLRQESPEVGMKVYMDFAMTVWYSKAVRNWQLVRSCSNQAHHKNRTLFLCYEDFLNTKARRTMLRKVTNWLYPGGYGGHSDKRSDGSDSDEGDGGEEDDDDDGGRVQILGREGVPFYGSHSSMNATDKVLKGELKELIRRLDFEVFNNTFAYLDSQFGCRGAKSTKRP
jgi:hypothetical protein